MICASWARFLSSQKTAGAPEARARLTASFTQSWTGASLVWQARQMSPASTACSKQDVAGGVGDADRAVAGISKVLLCEPYSSAAWAMRPTLGTEPMVFGSKRAVLLQKSRTAW